jgi:Domain of unknown function (DUF4209)
MGPSSPIHGSKEKLSSEVKTAILNNINLFDALICNNFADLESKNKLTTVGVKEFFESYGIFDNTSDFLIYHGLEKHFQKDFVASMHILIPQIEALLRRLLQLKKASFFKLKKDAIMSRELGGLLELNELSDILGLNLIKYLKLKYTDINGLKLRNNLSHGFLQKEDFNHTNSCSIIYGIMVILKASDKI